MSLNAQIKYDLNYKGTRLGYSEIRLYDIATCMIENAILNDRKGLNKVNLTYDLLFPIDASPNSTSEPLAAIDRIRTSCIMITSPWCDNKKEKQMYIESIFDELNNFKYDG